MSDDLALRVQDGRVDGIREQQLVRMDGTIVGCDPTTVSCDMAVELVWTDDDAPLPVRRPADPALRTR